MSSVDDSLFETRIEEFSIERWYNKFKHLTAETKLIELDTDLIAYVLRDRLILPPDNENDNEDDGEEEDDDDDQSIVYEKKYFESESFSKLKSQIVEVLERFGNEAFVKNNWHSAQDAKWVCAGRSLKVRTVNDILLLLKSSVIIRSDFSVALKNPILAIREWLYFHPADEFRCIVFHNILVGITPRDWPTFYAHYESSAASIIERLEKFFEKHIKVKFAEISDNYVFDVLSPEKQSPILIDFGALNKTVNLYAFEYKEIISLRKKHLEKTKPVFRFLTSETGISYRKQSDPFSKDLKDLIFS